MNKLLILVLGLAVAQAFENSVATHSGSDTLINEDFFNFAYTWKYDVAYKTVYTGTQAVTPLTSKVFHRESYGLNFYTLGQFTFTMTCMKVHTTTWTFSFLPITYTPFLFEAAFIRPESLMYNEGYDFDILLTGSWIFKALQLQTIATENMLTTVRSFIDYAENKDTYKLIPETINPPDFTFNALTLAKWTDPYWTYDLPAAENLIPTNLQDIYGTHDYFTFFLLGQYANPTRR
jgi:hypothetical protein